MIELADGRGEMCGRVLADLGADVIKVEPPGGCSARAQPPLCGGIGVGFALRNAGKRSVVVDLEREPNRLVALLDDADVWIEATRPGTLARLGVDARAVRRRNPRLVVISITDFGQTGPYRDWVATDEVLLAMGGVLSRSGLPGREPLIPPAGIADQLTAMQAAWATLVAYWNRLETGVGDHIDFSRYEATAQAIEPAMGTVGTAQAAGYAPTRDRPAPGPYPIFRCSDGHVRVVLLAPRQWRAMRAWLGDPDELQDPALDTIAGRAAAAGVVQAVLEDHFRDRGKYDLAAEGQALGVPVAPVLSLPEVLAAEHFRTRGAIARMEIAPGLIADLPAGFAEIDCRRVRPAGRAPALGEHDSVGRVAPGRSDPPESPAGESARLPLAGLRVLDFGVIVFGAEVARLFCELGAEVIKVESRAFPDGARVSPVHFAIGHRGSKSIGVNLRSDEGRNVIRRLAKQSDLMLANFKPGTLEKLGLGPEALRKENPRLVVATSSALGASGPWSAWMGYGPLVRAVSGLTSLWRYRDDPESFSDSTVIHPDHYAARITAVTALAALIARRRTGAGAELATSQAEAILMQIGAALAGEAGAADGGAARAESHRLYRCAGEDEWCVISIRDDDDRRRAREAIAAAPSPGVEEQLEGWALTRTAREVAATLQAAGVPAGFMQRGDEYENDPHLQARDFLRTFEQPGLAPLRIENAPFRSERIPPPSDAPAPELGEHTREICRALLGMDDGEIDALMRAGALEEPALAPS